MWNYVVPFEDLVKLPRRAMDMQKLFDDFVALLRNFFALQESGDFSTILWNYG